MADDTSDLPPELVKQLRKRPLSASHPSPMDEKLLAIIADLGGAATLDDLLIQMWRRHQLSLKRSFIGNRARRLVSAGLLDPIEGRKGHWRLSLDAARTEHQRV